MPGLVKAYPAERVARVDSAGAAAVAGGVFGLHLMLAGVTFLSGESIGGSHMRSSDPLRQRQPGGDRHRDLP